MQTQGGHGSTQQSQHTPSSLLRQGGHFSQAKAASPHGQAASDEPSAKGGSGFPHLSTPRQSSQSHRLGLLPRPLSGETVLTVYLCPKSQRRL